MENSSLRKKINKNLVFNVNNINTKRSSKSTVCHKKSLSKTNSVEKRPENYAFPSVVAPRLQNLPKYNNTSFKCQFAKKIIEAAEEWIRKILTYVCSQKLKLMKFFQTNNFI